MSNTALGTFRNHVYHYFKLHGRQLPWRDTPTPYAVLVSEIMLQQTQVDRVRDAFVRFITRFPNVQALAGASAQEVLAAWSGLGYNRRALHLQAAAQKIVEEFAGVIPRDHRALTSLPGIGAATASSIRAFAFNKPEVFIETNIRSVFIHHFFNDQTGITDAQIAPFVEQSLDRRNPRRWYSALMDYGVYLKKTYPNPSRKSAHHIRQSPFQGSDRQLRGAIIRELLKKKQIGREELRTILKIPPPRFIRIITGLIKDGMLHSREDILFL